MAIEASEHLASSEVAAYTQAIRRMTDEIACGMRAMAAHSIGDLRASLSRQQADYAALSVAAEAFRAAREQTWELAPELTSAIAAAQKELLHSVRCYEGMVERGRRSAAVLEVLCTSYAGQYTLAVRSLRGTSYLSCEA